MHRINPPPYISTPAAAQSQCISSHHYYITREGRSLYAQVHAVARALFREGGERARVYPGLVHLCSELGVRCK